MKTLDDIQTEIWELQSRMIEDPECKQEYAERLRELVSTLEDAINAHDIWELSAELLTTREIVNQLPDVEDFQWTSENLKDKYTTKFDLYPDIRWTADSKEEYENIEAEIQEAEIQGIGWEMYCWCDVSGFEYWMEKQQEPNYVQISLLFNKVKIPKPEIKKINDAFCEFYNQFKQYESFESELWY